jgi:hypothetical protein
MTKQRNAAVKMLGAETTLGWEMVPMSHLDRGGQQHGYTFYFSGPPGAPEPQVGRPTYSFDFGNGPVNVMEVCGNYLRLLEQLIRDFKAAHP